jgi:uncharacterized tellurite resistance protein B-like protein
MLEKITHFFEKHIVITSYEENIEEKLQTASAALFMEMLHAEAACSREKHQLILELLGNTYNLSEEQAAALMEIAEHKREQATDYFEFTHLICDAFTHQQKIQLLESLWKIALADHNLGFDEEYLVDKVARLLYIPRIEVLNARNKAKR